MRHARVVRVRSAIQRPFLAQRLLNERSRRGSKLLEDLPICLNDCQTIFGGLLAKFGGLLAKFGGLWAKPGSP